MAGLCWIAVVLVLSLSAEDSLAAVDQNWLTSITEGIKNQYALGDTFSLAVNVPQGQDPNDLQQVFQDDPADKVKQTVSEGQVYQGTRVVAAAQSVSRVLQNLQPLIKSSQGNFLIIYSEESPCGTTCTNEDGIDGKTNDVIQNWGGYAFVFSKVGDVPGADTSQLSESFKQLEISKLGLDNIFRCYKPGDDPFQCTSCSSGGDVEPSCLTNNALSNQEQPTGQESPVPATGTDQQVTPGEGVATGTGEGAAVGIAQGKGGKAKKKAKQRKGGKIKKGRKQKKGGKMKKRGKGKKGRKGKKRGKGKKGRKGKKWGKGKKGRKGKKWGKGKKGRKGKKRGKGKKGSKWG